MRFEGFFVCGFVQSLALGFALQAVSGFGTSACAPGLPVRRKLRVARMVLAATTLIAILAAYFAGRYRGHSASPSQPLFRQLTFRQGTIRNARFSPDEKTIIYGASMDGLPPRVYVTHTDAQNRNLWNQTTSVCSA